MSPADHGAPSPGTAAPAAPGGFSLRKLLSTRPETEPGKARSHSIAAVFATDPEPEPGSIEFEDVVKAGVVPEGQVARLFEFYFVHQNALTSLLDPTLHKLDFVRRDAFLFSAILAVAAKIALPELYPSAINHTRKLLGQAFEHGTLSIELVQAIATVVFFVDADDNSGARKLAYAIRGASELGLFKRVTAYPQDLLEARKVLNRERTWIYLMIADHRFSTQRSLPRMIPPEQRRQDTNTWIHQHVLSCPCPSEAGLAPLGGIAKLLDLYEVLVTPSRAFDGPDEAVLACLESEFASWVGDWAGDQTRIHLQPVQIKLIRLYARAFRYQIDEVHLIIAVASRAVEATKVKAITAFRTVIRSALDVLEYLREILGSTACVWESAFIAAASTSVWLASNAGGMAQEDKSKVLRELELTQAALDIEANGQEKSMAAYTSRLIAHWIKKTESPADRADQPAQPTPFVTASLNSHFFDAEWGQQQPVWQPDLGQALTNGDGLGAYPFFTQIVNPQSLEQEAMYPPLDDRLWNSLFPYGGAR